MWEAPPGVPKPEIVKDIRNQARPFSYEPFARGQAFWVDPPDFRDFCRRFGGYGGLMVLFSPAADQQDPLAALPAALFENPFLKQTAKGLDLQRELRQLQRLRDRRLAALKEAFGRDWAGQIDLEKIVYLVPKLKSMDFFSLERPLLEALTRSFPVCFFESPPDGGLLVASATPFEGRMSALMTQVRAGFEGEKNVANG
ncbi:MAG: hypothetical protein ACUVS7_04910 [Bryobacteraceae bacterium]